MEYAQWLKHEMEKKDLTSYRLHKITGLHQTTIKNLLDGRTPQADTAEKIKTALDSYDPKAMVLSQKKEKPLANGKELDAQTAEWNDIWDHASPEERADLLAMSRMILRRSRE